MILYPPVSIHVEELNMNVVYIKYHRRFWVPWTILLYNALLFPLCSVILPGCWKIPGYFSVPRFYWQIPGYFPSNTRVFDSLSAPVKYPGKWQLMTAETTCGLFRRISGVLSFTDFSLSSSLMLDACNLYTALLELKKLRGLREWLLLKGGKPGGGGEGSDHGPYDSPRSDCKQI